MISQCIFTAIKNRKINSLDFNVIADMLIDESMDVVSKQIRDALKLQKYEKQHQLGKVILTNNLIPYSVNYDEDTSEVNLQARTRRVNLEHAKERVICRSLFQNLVIYADNGGTVPNCYRYPATTQTVFAAATSVIRKNKLFIYCFLHSAEIRANKATNAGVANRAGYRELFDYRYGEERTEEARKRLKTFLLRM